MSELLNVSGVARLLDLSVDTIRRWEKKGLIKAGRDENNHRAFDVSEVERVQAKMDGKHTGEPFQVIKSKSHSDLTVVDLFSGAGGTSLGFENAGLEHKVLVEYDKDAVSTLRQNRPGWNVIHDDIRNVSFSGINADIVQGGFPCQAFSYAGNKRGFEDTRGTLFFEFARAVKEIKPKIAIGENVRGLLRHDGGRTLKTMISALNEIGYRVTHRVLRSQYFDVPQKRERLIIIAVRDDLDIPFLYPKEKNYLITLREALAGVPGSEGQAYPERKAKVLKMIPPGGYWKDLPDEIQRDYMGASYFHSGGKTGMARRLSWDEPSLTLTTSPAQKQTERCHPDETRPLTVREYARIQTFPDEWEFSGSVSSQYKQIGNAVPVNLGYYIGKAAIAMITGKYDDKEFVQVGEVGESVNTSIPRGQSLPSFLPLPLPNLG